MQRFLISRKGVLSFEWIVLISIITILLVVGFGTIRNSYVLEYADVVNSIFQIDQHLHYQQMRIRVEIPVVVSHPILGAHGNVAGYVQENTFMKFEGETAGSKNINTAASSNNQVMYVDFDL